MNRAVVWLLLLCRLNFSAGTCQTALSAMVVDANFVSVNATLYEACYVQYQNDRYGNKAGKTVCQPWEYGSFCNNQLGGRTCVVFNTFLEMSVCVPAGCSDSDLDQVNTILFQTEATAIDCSPEPVSALVPALVATGLVLLITALLVFAIRPPKHVREEKRLGKGKRLISSVSGQFGD